MRFFRSLSDDEGFYFYLCCFTTFAVGFFFGHVLR